MEDGNYKVLLLNTTFEPLSIITLKRAYKLLFSKKAYTLEHTNDVIKTVRATIKIPSVIQISYYIKKPYSKPKFSKKSVFLRDNYICQYCGKKTSHPTLDHIIPKSKGGKTNWKNVVTACPKCNNKKGNRTLKESGMKLIKPPEIPKYIILPVLTPNKIKKWEKYLNPDLRDNYISDHILAAVQ